MLKQIGNKRKMVNYDRVRAIYETGGNIIEMLKDQYSNELSHSEIVQISYDIQAGAYTRKALANPEIESSRGSIFASIINNLGSFDSIMEAGVGEATSMTAIVKNLDTLPKTLSGFDISLSRLGYARNFVQEHLPINADFAVADMENIPLPDSSMDLVYTVHALEPNGGNEAALLEELYRVTRKFLVLFEPSYELGNEQSRAHIDKHNYIKGLVDTALTLGCKVIENKLLFDSNHLSANNTSVIVIEKPYLSSSYSAQKTKTEWACPISKHQLVSAKGCYYSPKSNVAYAKVGGLPILLTNRAILATHFDEL